MQMIRFLKILPRALSVQISTIEAALTILNVGGIKDVHRKTVTNVPSDVVVVASCVLAVVRKRHPRLKRGFKMPLNVVVVAETAKLHQRHRVVVFALCHAPKRVAQLGKHRFAIRTVRSNRVGSGPFCFCFLWVCLVVRFVIRVQTIAVKLTKSLSACFARW